MIYTVEQIVQAVGTLDKTEKERLMRALAKLDQGPEAAREALRPSPAAEADYVLTYHSDAENGIARFSLWTRADPAPRLHRLPLAGAASHREAEYDALLAGLERLAADAAARGEEVGQLSVEIRGASRLVVQQVMGLWKAGNARLQGRRDQALALLRQFGAFRFRELPSSEVAALLGD